MGNAPDNLLHAVTRSDDNGGTYLIRDGLDAEGAEGLRALMAARGHKQDYRVSAYREGFRTADLAALGVREQT